MKVTHITLALVIATAGAASAQDSAAAVQAAPNLTVEAVLTRGVVDRVPQDTVTAVPVDVGSVSLWTRVTGADPGTVIHHVWYHGDEQVGDVELTLGGSPWRTWSRKTIPMEWTGAWRVEVKDAAGNVLQTISFTVGQSVG
jgi:DUF2914 family protein